MTDWNAESLIDNDAVDALSIEDLKKILAILTKAGY
tara:strand:- start:818 stop:925 length:108 start_codon:yes stop_codon:yes gene_type:complete